MWTIVSWTLAYTMAVALAFWIDRDGKALGEKLDTQVGGTGGDAQHVAFNASLQLETSLKDMEDRTSCSCGHFIILTFMWTHSPSLLT